MYIESHNCSMINRIIVNQWNSSFIKHYWNKKQQNDQNFVLDEDKIKVIKDFMNISDQFVQTLIQYWWFSTGNRSLNKQINKLRQTTGTILKCDHTYYIVSSLGININKLWVSNRYL